VPFLLAINIFMKSFICATLVDITPTNVIKGDSLARDQQRNWETVLQVLSLKTQPIILGGPELMSDIDGDGVSKIFGEFYQTMQKVWVFEFTSEQNIYTIDQLYEDFEQVPVISGLDESARFMLPIFHSYGILKNIYFSTVGELNIS
jgi:hypothetical protein